MANIDDSFRIDKLSLNDNILMTEGSIDPSVVGYEAPTNSLYFNTELGIFRKTGSNATDWITIGGVDSLDAFTALKEPTGFYSRTTSQISFNDSIRTFTIAPLAPSTFFLYYIRGIGYKISTSQSIVIPNITGTYYIYLDSDQQLHYQTNFEELLVTGVAIVAIVYWNATQQSRIYFADERHGTVMDGMTHLYLHTNYGAKYVTGLGINGFVPGNDDDLDVQINVYPGAIRDEDLLHSIYQTGNKINSYDLEQLLSKPAQIPVLYRLGASGEWFIKSPTNYPFIHAGTASYTGTLAPFNEWTGTTWQLTEMSSNHIGAVHIYATNCIDHPIIAVQGINQYQNKPYGFELGEQELKQLQGLPFAEFVPIGSLIFSTSTTYTSTYKVQFESTTTGQPYVDWRQLDVINVTNLGIMEHDSLSGLADDDHTQYALAGAGSTRTFNFGDLYNINDYTRTSSDNNTMYGLHWDNTNLQYNIDSVRLETLSDVGVTNGIGIDGKLLQYDNATNKWVAHNLTSTEVTTALGYTPLSNTGGSISGSISFPKTKGVGILIDNTYGWSKIAGDITPKTSDLYVPTYSNFIGSIGGWAHQPLTYGYIEVELPYDYAPDTDVYLNIHWGHNGTNIDGDFKINFSATYSKRSSPAVFTTPVSLSNTVSGVNITNSPRYCHRVMEILLSTPGGSSALLNTTNLEVDGIIKVRYDVEQVPAIIGSDTNNYPYIFTMDIHYQSTGIGTKNSSPDYYA